MEFLTLSRLFMYSEDTESGAHLAVQGQSERSTLCSGASTVSKMLRLAHEYIYLYIYIYTLSGLLQFYDGIQLYSGEKPSKF